MAQRRILFEVLGFFAYAIAIALCVFNILNWTDHASFVISCTALWALLSAIIVVRLMWINAASQKNKVLEIPDSWDESSINWQGDNLIDDELPATKSTDIAITGADTVHLDAEQTELQNLRKQWGDQRFRHPNGVMPETQALRP